MALPALFRGVVIAGILMAFLADLMGHLLQGDGIIKTAGKTVLTVAGHAFSINAIGGIQRMGLMIKGDITHAGGEQEEFVSPGLGSGQLFGRDLLEIAAAVTITVKSLDGLEIQPIIPQGDGIAIEAGTDHRHVAGPAGGELTFRHSRIDRDKTLHNAWRGKGRGYTDQNRKNKQYARDEPFHSLPPFFSPGFLVPSAPADCPADRGELHWIKAGGPHHQTVNAIKRHIGRGIITPYYPFPQHFLYFLPLLHGQGSLRPILVERTGAWGTISPST